MIIFLYRIIFGFLRISIYGDFKERALTLCAQNGITLWNNQLKDGKIECNILVRDFRFLRSVIRGKEVKVHILKKRGVPFILNRYRKRSGIFVGAVLFFTVIQLMSGYIWIIDVEGNQKVSREKILSACHSIGLDIGIRKDSFYPKLKREELMLCLDGVAWSSLNVEGSRLTVNVTETKEGDKQKTYSNLKAECDGIIEKMDITSGTSVVSVGQAVKKGDLLVSGIIETADVTRFVNSRGKVYAKTMEEISLNENYSQKHSVPIGKVKTKTVIEAFGFKIPLYLGVEKEPFETEKNEKILKLFSVNLPIKIHTKNFVFLKEERVTYSYEELCSRLEKRLKEQMEKTENGELKHKEFIKTEKGVTLKAEVEREQNIAIEDNLIISAGN